MIEEMSTAFSRVMAPSCRHQGTDFTVTDDDLLLKETDSLKVPEQLTQTEAQKDTNDHSGNFFPALS